jgi:uncharacterized membrane protein
MSRQLLFLLAVLGLTATGCSDSTSPSGGPKDAPPAPELSVASFGVTAIESPSHVSAVNDEGLIVGTSQTDQLGFVWVNGAAQWLSKQSGIATAARDVNSFGLVVGRFISTLGTDSAAAWLDGIMTLLPGFYEAGTTIAMAVNDPGQILGTDVATGEPRVGLVWSSKDDQTPTRLKAPDGYAVLPEDIDDAGRIVGQLGPVDGTHGQAVYWSSESATPLTLKGFDGTPCENESINGLALAFSLNEQGEIVGTCPGADGSVHAAYWASAGATAIDLGPGEAESINELGEVVGSGPLFTPSLWMREAGTFRRFDLGSPQAVGFVSFVDVNNTGTAVGNFIGTESDGYAWHIPIRVALDLIPGSATNTIKRDGRGTVTVALLGSRWFRAADVDPASLSLGNDDGQDTPVARKKTLPLAKLTDVNRDGLPDLVVEFNMLELMNRGDLPLGNPVLVLLGALRDGTHLRGADAALVLR